MEAVNGASAEYITTTLDSITQLPPNLSFEHAATISGGGTTAWMALFEHGHLKAGQHVLIHGASGGVGSYAVQFAKWKGAEVIATGSARNKDYIKSLGADVVIDYEKDVFEDVVDKVELVLDGVGGETLNRSWSIVKRGGTLLSLVDVPPADKALQFGIHARFSNALAPKEVFQQIAQLLSEEVIKPPATIIFPFHEIKEAHQLSQTGHSRGRIVLQVAASHVSPS